jgi:hypothetical protein
MPSDSFLAIPVGAVEDDWLATGFRPNVIQCLDSFSSTGGLVMLPVDSGAEADYLLSQIALMCRQASFVVKEIEVNRVDPFRFWGAFSGTCEQTGLFGALRSMVSLVQGGEMLPIHSIATHLNTLVHLIRATSTTVVLPLFFSQVSAFEKVMPGFPRLAVPSLANTPVERRKQLVHSLVSSRVQGLAPSQKDEFVARLLEGQPLSRSQIEYWLDGYGSTDNPLEHIRRIPPPLPDGPAHEPPAVPTRKSLQERFISTLTWLRETDAQLQAVYGKPALFKHQPLRDPFESSEPNDWLVALVTHLSCLVFDAGKNTLDCLADYSYDPNAQDIIGQACSSLVPNLRALRTIFQHGISVENERNHDTIRKTTEWYYRSCGTHNPNPEHARLLASALLALWEELVHGIHQVVANLRTAPSAAVVRNRLDAESRNIEQGELLRLIDVAIQRIDPAVDSERVKKKYEEHIRNNLKASCFTGHAYLELARQLVEEAVARESRRCPIDSPWLQAQGLTPGPKFGYWLKLFIQEWDNMPPSVSAEEFKNRAKSRLTQESP